MDHVGNPLAWKLKKLSDDTEDIHETAVSLTSDERKALLGATDPSTADRRRGIDHRRPPHELAGAVVSDFDNTALRLAHRPGLPPKLRVRYVTLEPEGVHFFATLVDGKARTALIFKPE